MYEHEYHNPAFTYTYVSTVIRYCLHNVMQQCVTVLLR